MYTAALPQMENPISFLMACEFQKAFCNVIVNSVVAGSGNILEIDNYINVHFVHDAAEWINVCEPPCRYRR